MKRSCIVLLKKYREQFAMLLATVMTKNLLSIFKLLDDKKKYEVIKFFI
jgi:hypothetical protein